MNKYSFGGGTVSVFGTADWGLYPTGEQPYANVSGLSTADPASSDSFTVEHHNSWRWVVGEHHDLGYDGHSSGPIVLHLYLNQNPEYIYLFYSFPSSGNNRYYAIPRS